MKLKYQIISVFVFLMLFTACNNGSQKETISTDVINNPSSASSKNNKKEQPKIEFSTKEHDFGKVINGEIVRYNFKFTNTGGSDLVITSVNADCGCTVAEYSRKPVKPGEKGYINIQFDSNNRTGFNHKTATVLSNAVPNKVQLHIKAKVYQP
ncbi:MAG: DUF1573 domain-containing protein [Bacteroidales bacterium]|nr:DUF1573 domain-containing protein [Bacteroidales bacterium]